MTAIVTGASRGIGRAVALRLASDGLAVAVNYRERADAAEDVVESISRNGGKARAIAADTADAEQCAYLTAQAETHLGPVSILINNAGLLYRGSIDSFDLEAMHTMYRVNVDGVIHMIRAVSDGMRKRNAGSIVNLSSIAAAGTTASGTTYYAATKAAVETLTRRFALELGPFGIRVNAVAPGFVVTDMVQPMATPEARDQLLAAMATKAVLGRIGMPEDIADAVAFIASDQARFITGQILTVDGGRTDFLSH